MSTRAFANAPCAVPIDLASREAWPGDLVFAQSADPDTIYLMRAVSNGRRDPAWEPLDLRDAGVLRRGRQ